VAQVYAENDASAFKRSRVRLPDGSTGLRVVRPVFRRLLDDLAAGVIGRDGRLRPRPDRPRSTRPRRPHRRHRGAQDPDADRQGGIDLSTDSGITMSRIMVGIANKSSRDTSRASHANTSS